MFEREGFCHLADKEITRQKLEIDAKQNWDWKKVLVCLEAW